MTVGVDTEAAGEDNKLTGLGADRNRNKTQAELY
jgi:hypothetical protein